jgi:hypothetical protein
VGGRTRACGPWVLRLSLIPQPHHSASEGRGGRWHWWPGRGDRGGPGGEGALCWLAVMFCGMAGFSDFYKAQWLETTVSWQRPQESGFGKPGELRFLPGQEGAGWGRLLGQARKGCIAPGSRRVVTRVRMHAPVCTHTGGSGLGAKRLQVGRWAVLFAVLGFELRAYILSHSTSLF